MNDDKYKRNKDDDADDEGVYFQCLLTNLLPFSFVGFAIGVWNLPALIWLLFCLSTFVPRSRNNHDFYRVTFPDYPQSRKRFIPFIY